MIFPLEQIQVPNGPMTRIEIRIAGKSKGSERVALSRSEGSGDALTIEDVNSAETLQKVSIPARYDWCQDKEHRQFALLERKVGRNDATPEEKEEYESRLKSRRAWIKRDTYMAEYVEEQRSLAIMKKLEELRELIKPIKV